MDFQKYVYVVNGASESGKPVLGKPVHVVNRDTGITSYIATVYVINQMPRTDWPRKYENVFITNGQRTFGKDEPKHYDNVYVVNFEALKSLPALRKVFDPEMVFVRCPRCGVEFLTWEAPFRSAYNCPVCKRPFPDF